MVVFVEPYGWLSSMLRNGEVERVMKPGGGAPPSAGVAPDSSGSFDNRFGTWPPSPTGGVGNPLSPLPRGPRKRSAAPDGAAWATAQGQLRQHLRFSRARSIHQQTIPSEIFRALPLLPPHHRLRHLTGPDPALLLGRLPTSMPSCRALGIFLMARFSSLGIA
jgi:hypothetical protein